MSQYYCLPSKIWFNWPEGNSLEFRESDSVVLDYDRHEMSPANLNVHGEPNLSGALTLGNSGSRMLRIHTFYGAGTTLMVNQSFRLFCLPIMASMAAANAC